MSKNRISKQKIETSEGLISTKLLNSNLLSAPISLVLILLIPSYFSITAATIMIFGGNDGNCAQGLRTFGDHCFGDYGTMVNLTQPEINPWSEGSPLSIYPPLNLVLFKVITIFDPVRNLALCLTLYLVTIVLSGLYPIWKETRKIDQPQRALTILFLGVLALPLIAAIDRGNNAVWAIPFLYISITSILQKKDNSTILFLAIAIALRPQLVIFLLILIMTKQYLSTLKTLVLSFAIYVLSFALYLGSFDFKVLVNYYDATRKFGSGIPGDWPPNLSLARGLKVFLSWFSIKPTDSVTIAIASTVVFCSFICIYFLKETLRIRSAIFLLIPIIFLAAPMTWVYYGAFLVIATALFLREKVTIGGLFKQRNLAYMYVSGIHLTNSLLFIPILDNNNNLVQYLIPVYWSIFYILFITQSVFLSIKNRMVHKRNA